MSQASTTEHQPVAGERFRFRRLRLQEPSFWLVQLGVAIATAIHFLLEWTGVLESPIGLHTGLHYFPVILYAVPVAYASLRYGIEGGLFTGLLSALLNIPNAIFWHDAEFAWVGEVGATILVIALGVLVALPVQRERRERQRAEETSRRLAFLNSVTGSMTRSLRSKDFIGLLLDRLIEALDLEAAAFSAADGEGAASPMIGTRSSTVGRHRLQEVMGEDLPWADKDVRWRAGVISIPVTGRDMYFGAIVVAWSEGTSPSDEDVALLVAVTGELGVALDNARLHEQENLRLQRYVKEVTRAQEDERKRIARELHDSVAQPLILLSRGLERLATDGRRSGGVADRAAELRGVTLEILKTIRSFSHDLRPTVLDDLGLAPALEWLPRDLAERSGLETEFRIEGRPRRLSSDTEVAVFRVAQEALRNVEKHARATKASLVVTFAPGHCRLCITDGGVGFDPTHLGQWTTLGINGMRERAELVGGRIAIDAEPTHGTVVTLDVEA
ncbi:MAG: histidine kinase [Acidimicrobiia bacterium]